MHRDLMWTFDPTGMDCKMDDAGGLVHARTTDNYIPLHHTLQVVVATSK